MIEEYFKKHEQYIASKKALNESILKSLESLDVKVGSLVYRDDDASVGIVKRISIPETEALPPFYHIRIHWKFRKSSCGLLSRVSHSEWVALPELLNFKFKEGTENE